MHWQAFRPPVGLWMKQHADYDIDVAEHEGWDFFDECIRPSPETWLFLADQQVVQSLVQHGSDAAKEHALEFVFLGEQAGLQQVSENLTAHGYTLQEPADLASGQVVLIRKMRVDLEEIFAASLQHTRLAGECGVEYDGWGAEIVK